MTFPTRAVAIFGSTLILSGLAAAGAAAPAYAHTPAVTADCDSLSIRLTGYTLITAQPASGGDPAVAADSTPNSVTVTIDGTAAAPVYFGTTYTSTIALDDQKPHTYTVALDAHDRGYDYTVSDSTAACPAAVTPPPTTPPTPTAPPTTAPPTTAQPTPTPTPTATIPPIAPPTPTTSMPPAVVTPPMAAPTPTPPPAARELAATGTSTIPALAAGSLAVLLGAGLVLARRLRRA